MSTDDTAGVLLETVRQLAAELRVRPGEEIAATLDSSLERDLGFDSLGRVELFARMFGVSLPVQTRQLFHGEWLDSGDFAYLAAGDVYLTGRAKDIIIRAAGLSPSR